MHSIAKHPKNFVDERQDLAAAFRWAARLNLHEAVANHFSLAIDDSGRRFLMNPDQRHFSLIKASELLILDVDDPHTLDREDAPDITAWGLHGMVHRHCPHARCVMHLHPMVLGDSVADTFNRLYYFERAAETYIRALQTGQPLRVLDSAIAEKTAQELEMYPDQSERHFSDLKAILDQENSDYAQ